MVTSQPEQTDCHNVQRMDRAALFTIDTISPAGEAYPKFLIEHVREQWHGVALDRLNPDICLKVDSALSYAGCEDPSFQVRQFLYIYHESTDFDHEVLQLLVHLFDLAEDNETVWNNLVALDFQRDCGLGREEYIAELCLMIEDLEFTAIMQPSEILPTQLSA